MVGTAMDLAMEPKKGRKWRLSIVLTEHVFPQFAVVRGR
jgi:hypothetical protein